MSFEIFIFSILFITGCSNKLICPLQNGMIIQKEIPKFSMSDPNGQIEIESENPEVYSVSSGEIIKIIQIGNRAKTILIKSKNNRFYVYSNLEKVNFKNGDSVKKNEVLGELKFDENQYVLRFGIRENSEKINPE